MRSPPAPSTAWQERITPGEELRFAGYARQFAEIQARRSAVWGPGRTLHRKQITAAHGILEVLDGLPAFCKQGMFEQPGEYDVWVRLSNGGLDRAQDRVPDIRGFSLRVLGVEGESALGRGPAASQDFTLINQETFGFCSSGEFVEFVVAASRGKSALLKHLFQRYGWLGAARQLGRMIKAAAKPFSGFATESFFSAVPMANGPYAVRMQLVPADANGRPAARARKAFAADFAGRLARQALHWDLQLQFFSSEELTPIENPSVNWPTPYSTVARLMLPPQSIQSEAGQTLARQVEAAVFDPWHALAAHRPLGEVQRARKVVYFESQDGRGAT
jgi:hypothetical protein